MSAIAAVFRTAGGPLALTSFDKPEPLSGEFIARIKCCTVCGSDVHTWTGKRPGPAPGVLGHEIVAEVERLGSGIIPADVHGHGLAVGDRVVWSVVSACGTCPPCRRGIPQKCQRGWKYGHQGTEDMTPSGRRSSLSGGLATHCHVVDGSAVVRVPAAVPDVLAATATCSGATAAAAIRVAGELRGRRVLVTGAGMLGLFAAALSAAAGADAVVVVDSQPRRLEVARRIGATETILTSPQQTLERSLERCPRPFDVFLECTGNAEVTESGAGAMGLGGMVVLVGAVYPQPKIRLDAQSIVRRLLTITGVHNYTPTDLVSALDFLSRGHAGPALHELISHPIPLTDIRTWQPLAESGGFLRVAVSPT